MALTKIMILCITGGTVDKFIFHPSYLIVEVIDPVELIGRIRMRVLKQLIDGALKGDFPESQIDQMLRTMKVQLVDTGLTEYPETPEAEAALIRKYTMPDNELNSIGTAERDLQPA